MAAQMVSPNMSDRQWFEMVMTFSTADLQMMLPLIEGQADKFRHRADHVRMLLELDGAS